MRRDIGWGVDPGWGIHQDSGWGAAGDPNWD